MNRPALRMALLVVLADVAVASTNPRPVVVLGAVFLGLAISAWRVAVLLPLLAVGVGALLGLEAARILPPSSQGPVPAAPARLHGIVSRVMVSDSSRMRLAVHGELDRKDLPAMQRTGALVIIIRPDARCRTIGIGTPVVITGTCHAPQTPVLPSDRISSAALLANDAWWTLVTDSTHVDIRGQGSWLATTIDGVRRTTTTVIGRTFSPDVAPYIEALLTGHEQGIAPADRSAFARTGTAHMFSVSGSHVAIIATLLAMLTSWLPPLWRATFIGVALLAFVIFTGAQPPAVRAWLAATCYVVGSSAERDIDGLNLLGAAILAMVFVDPVLPWRLSAQLSIAGVAGIIMLGPPLRALLDRYALIAPRWMRPARTALSVSLAASAGVAVPSAAAFGSVSLIAPFANLIVVPLLSCAMLSGALAVIIPHGDAYAAIAESCVRTAVVFTTYVAQWQFDVDHPVLTALALLGSMVWIACDRHASALLWKSLSSTIAISLVSTMPTSRPVAEVFIRPDVVAVLRRFDAVSVCWIIDRVEHVRRPTRDRALALYLVDVKPAYILERGVCSSSTVDMVEDAITVRRRQYLGE